MAVGYGLRLELLEGLGFDIRDKIKVKNMVRFRRVSFTVRVKG